DGGRLPVRPLREHHPHHGRGSPDPLPAAVRKSTMEYRKGDLARSLAGHDRGNYFIILAEAGEYVILVNGVSRTMERPKKKNKKHVQVVHRDGGVPATDEAVRLCIRDYEREIHQKQEESGCQRQM